MTGTALIVAQTPPPIHGSSLMASRLVDAIDQVGWRSVLVDKRFSSRIDLVGRASLRKVLAAPSLWARLLRALLRRPDVAVIFLTDRPGSFLVDAVSTWIVRAAKVRLIHQVHTQGFQALVARRGLWPWAVKRVLGAASQVSCLSRTLARDLEGLVSASRIHIIPNTVGESVPLDRRELEPPMLVFVANLFPSKRPEFVIETVERLQRRGVIVQARIAGAASDHEYQARLERRIKNSSASERIQLLGSIDEAQREALFRRASLLLHPTALDAQPLAVLEAMSFGIPVVATKIGGIPELIDRELIGRVVDANDLEGLVDAVAEVLRTIDTRSDQARRDHYDGIYSSNAFAQNWLRLLEVESRLAGGHL